MSVGPFGIAFSAYFLGILSQHAFSAYFAQHALRSLLAYLQVAVERAERGLCSHCLMFDSEDTGPFVCCCGLGAYEKQVCSHCQKIYSENTLCFMAIAVSLGILRLGASRPGFRVIFVCRRSSGCKGIGL